MVGTTCRSKHDAPVSAFVAIAKDYPSFELRLSLMTQSGAFMFELRAAEQAITPVQGAVVACAAVYPTRLAAPRVKRGLGLTFASLRRKSMNARKGGRICRRLG